MVKRLKKKKKEFSLHTYTFIKTKRTSVRIKPLGHEKAASEATRIVNRCNS